MEGTTRDWWPPCARRAPASATPPSSPGTRMVVRGTGGASAGQAEAAARRVATWPRVGASAVVVTEPEAMRRLWRYPEDGPVSAPNCPTGRSVAGWKTPACSARPTRLPARVTKLLGAHGLKAPIRPFRRRLHPCPDRFRSDQRRWVSASGASWKPQRPRRGPRRVAVGRTRRRQARGELLSRMYPPEIIAAFGAFKAAWDPDGASTRGASSTRGRLTPICVCTWGVPPSICAPGSACVTTTELSPGQPALYGGRKMHHRFGRGDVPQLPGHR